MDYEQEHQDVSRKEEKAKPKKPTIGIIIVGGIIALILFLIYS